MPLEDGIYIITNVKQRNLVFLENPDDCTPLQGHYRRNHPGEEWRVIDRGNGQHSIQNVQYNRYANCGSLAELRAFIEGRSREQLWHIQERSKGNYTIAATDTGNFWMLPYNEPGTPVGLLDKPTDQRCWWSFTNPLAVSPVNSGSTNECLLFELKLLPILPFSPLKLDFVVIQEITDDSISTASRSVREMCGPLVSSGRSRPDALCVNIIEFRAPSSNKVFFQRFSGFMTFEMLRNLEGPDVLWKRCGGSSLPEIAIRGLRADATKVAVLNLNDTLLQQGGQASITLINRLVKQDITLVLMPIQPTWGDIFYKGHVFEELERLSSESRLFEKMDGFSDYVLDYDDTVALPRLAEYPELHDETRPIILHLIDLLQDENPEVQLAAAAILSQLAEQEQLHDIIFQGVLKIIEMLTRDGGRAYIFERAEYSQLNGIFKDVYGRTALSWAAGSGYDAVVRLLLVQKYAEVDAGDERGQTPLLWASKNGHDAAVRLLLAQENVDADSKDRRGQTPLSWAAENGHDAVVRLLLAQEDVDVNSEEDDYNRTPLLRAAKDGHDAVVRLLLAHEGVDVNSKDRLGLTPLSWAASNGYDAVVRLLLAHEGVDVNSKDRLGQTPLSEAASSGHDAVVRLLLAQEGVDVNSKDSYDQTPLLRAASYGHDAVVRLLLAHEGVDVNSKDRPGRTPLSLAAENGHNSVVRLLLAHGAVDTKRKN